MPRSLELDEKAAYSADDANDVELDSLLPPAISEPSSSLAHHGGAVAQNAGSATTSKARKNSRSTPVPLLQISFIMIYKMAQVRLRVVPITPFTRWPDVPPARAQRLMLRTAACECSSPCHSLSSCHSSTRCSWKNSRLRTR